MVASVLHCRLVESLVSGDKPLSKGRQESPTAVYGVSNSLLSPEPHRHQPYGSAASVSSLDSDALTSNMRGGRGPKHTLRQVYAQDPVDRQIQTLTEQLAALSTSVATSLPRMDEQLQQQQYISAPFTNISMASRPLTHAVSSPPGMSAPGVSAYAATPIAPHHSSPTRRSTQPLATSMSLQWMRPGSAGVARICYAVSMHAQTSVCMLHDMRMHIMGGLALLVFAAPVWFTIHLM